MPGTLRRYRRDVATSETRAHEGSRRRIERLCSAATEAKDLRVRALDEIRTAVAFDAHVWLMTDPATAVGAAPVADVPSLAELPATIRLKYLTAVNRWTSLHASGRVVGLLRQGTGGDPAKSLMWRGILRRYGIRDVASAVFADRFGIWGFLDLWRAGPEPFDAADADYLASIVPPLTAASRSCQAQTFTTPVIPASPDLGPAVVLLDDALRVLSQTAASQEWLRILLPPTPPDQPPVPASVYNVAGQLLAMEQCVDGHPASARVHLADGLWVMLRAARLSRSDTAERGVIAVTIEETSAADRLDVFARAFGLSRRETELVGLLAAGGDTRELARQMYISEYTVQDHLKSIFAKTAASNRQTLLARAAGHEPGLPDDSGERRPAARRLRRTPHSTVQRASNGGA